MKNPFFKEDGEGAAEDRSTWNADVTGETPPETPAAAEALFDAATPLPAAEEKPDAEAEDDTPELLAAILPPEPAKNPSKKDAGHSPIAPWQRIVKARDEAVERLAPLQQRVAELEPIAAAVQARFAGRGPDPLVAMEWDASFCDAFEQLAKSNDPAALAAAEKVAAIMNGQQPAAATPAVPAKTPAAAAPAADPRLDAIIQRDAQREVSGSLRELGIADRRIDGMAAFIVRNAKDPASISDEVIADLGKRYVRENGFTKEELLAPNGKPNGSTRRPPTGAGRGAPAVAAAAEEPAEGAATPEFKSVKDWNKFKEKQIRSFAVRQG